MQKRRRMTVSLHDRLAAFAKDIRARAATVPPGPERNDLLKRAKQADDAARLDDWAGSLLTELGGSNEGQAGAPRKASGAGLRV
jgi:hypothetical protein